MFVDQEQKIELEIGGTTFQINPMVPTFKEFVQNQDEDLEMIIPDPAIPIADLLPM